MAEMEGAYVTLLGQGEGEYIEKRSKFLGFCAPVDEEDAALAVIAEQRKRYAAANHLIYAYSLRDGTCRYTDSGEPQGTAGATLEILRRGGITDAVITVARYFGGTLLGAGNLTRAYAEAAKRAVKTAGRAVMEPRMIFEIACGYAEYQSLIKRLAAHDADITDSLFAEQIVVTATLAPAQAEKLIMGVSEITKGQSSPIHIGDAFRRVILDD